MEKPSKNFQFELIEWMKISIRFDSLTKINKIEELELENCYIWYLSITAIFTGDIQLLSSHLKFLRRKSWNNCSTFVLKVLTAQMACVCFSTRAKYPSTSFFLCFTSLLRCLGNNHNTLCIECVFHFCLPFL